MAGRIVLVTGRQSRHRSGHRPGLRRATATGWPSPIGREPVEGFCSVRCDVTSSDDVDAAFSAVEEQLGPVEILVSNAGANADQLLLSMKEDAWSSGSSTPTSPAPTGWPAGPRRR